MSFPVVLVLNIVIIVILGIVAKMVTKPAS